MKWKVKVEWLNHEVVSMSIVESEDGSDTKMKAIDDFAVDWLNCAGLWKPQTDPRNEWFEQAKAKGELFYRELPNRKCHWEHKSGEGWSSHTLVDDTIAEQKKAKEEIKPYELSDTDDIIEASKKFAKEPSLARYCYSVEIMKADHGHRLDNIEAHIAKIEERLTEIEGVLSSIGSPDYDLRKKVEEIEEKVKALDKWRMRHLMIFHDKPLTEEQEKVAEKLCFEHIRK